MYNRYNDIGKLVTDSSELEIIFLLTGVCHLRIDFKNRFNGTLLMKDYKSMGRVWFEYDSCSRHR